MGLLESIIGGSTLWPRGYGCYFSSKLRSRLYIGKPKGRGSCRRTLVGAAICSLCIEPHVHPKHGHTIHDIHYFSSVVQDCGPRLWGNTLFLLDSVGLQAWGPIGCLVYGLFAAYECFRVGPCSGPLSENAPSMWHPWT